MTWQDMYRPCRLHSFCLALTSQILFHTEVESLYILIFRSLNSLEILRSSKFVLKYSQRIDCVLLIINSSNLMSVWISACCGSISLMSVFAEVCVRCWKWIHPSYWNLLSCLCESLHELDLSRLMVLLINCVNCWLFRLSLSSRLFSISVSNCYFQRINHSRQLVRCCLFELLRNADQSLSSESSWCQVDRFSSKWISLTWFPLRGAECNEP